MSEKLRFHLGCKLDAIGEALAGLCRSPRSIEDERAKQGLANAKEEIDRVKRLARINLSAFRAAQCDELGHTWSHDTQICDHCGARMSVEVALGRAEPPNPVPSPHERYAAFRATVERVVAEEAPRAKVVTDMCGPRSIFSGGSVAWWITIGDAEQTGRMMVSPDHEWDTEVLKNRITAACHDLRHRLGMRAMGQKEEKNR